MYQEGAIGRGDLGIDGKATGKRIRAKDRRAAQVPHSLILESNFPSREVIRKERVLISLKSLAKEFRSAFTEVDGSEEVKGCAWLDGKTPVAVIRYASNRYYLREIRKGGYLGNEFSEVNPRLKDLVWRKDINFNDGVMANEEDVGVGVV